MYESVHAPDHILKELTQRPASLKKTTRIVWSLNESKLHSHGEDQYHRKRCNFGVRVLITISRERGFISNSDDQVTNLRPYQHYQPLGARPPANTLKIARMKLSTIKHNTAP